jgi:hypothetical protein
MAISDIGRCMVQVDSFHFFSDVYFGMLDSNKALT